ncbi:MAG: hypothetical protein WC451_03170 [Patescibacteria group bacterium]|jgi:hypothetical protein
MNGFFANGIIFDDETVWLIGDDDQVYVFSDFEYPPEPGVNGSISVGEDQIICCM